MTKQRKPRADGYRNVSSMTGEISPRIPADLAVRIKRYCRMTGISCTAFVVAAVRQHLSDLEPELYNSLTREQLIELLQEDRR